MVKPLRGKRDGTPEARALYQQDWVARQVELGHAVLVDGVLKYPWDFDPDDDPNSPIETRMDLYGQDLAHDDGQIARSGVV